MNTLVKVIGYEIYLQDLSNMYISLTLLGKVNTHSEAINCCKLFREALDRNKLDPLYSNCTVIFRPIVEDYNE